MLYLITRLDEIYITFVSFIALVLTAKTKWILTNHKNSVDRAILIGKEVEDG